MSFPKFRLRKSLYLIGQNMGGHDLSSLKFLSGLPKGRQEKIETAFELFCTLESRGEIDYKKDDVLRELLEARHREHLLNKYPLDGPEDLETDAGGKVYSDQEIKQLKKFLTGISESLSHRDFKDLAYFLFDTDATATRGTYSFQEMEQMSSALDLFEKLIAARLIGPSNLTALYQVLEVIGRNDICVKIAEYLPQSGAARRRSLKLQSLSSYSSSYSSSSSSSSPSSSMEASRPTTSASHPTSSSSSNSYLAYSPASPYPPYYDSFDKISRDVGKSPRPSAPPTLPGPPPQNPSIPVHTGHQPQEQPQPQLNMNRPPQGGANILLPSTQQPPAQVPTPVADQHSIGYKPVLPQAPTAAAATHTQMEYQPSQPLPQTSPVANHQVQPVPSQPQPQATPNQSSQIPLPVQQSFVGQAEYSSGETVVAMEEEGQADEEMDTGGPVTGGPRSLLEQLEDENQTLKDIAAQQFRLIQDLTDEKEEQKKKPAKTSSNNSNSPRSGRRYEMGKNPHGIAIVIGNEKFRKSRRRPDLVLTPRNGCLSDVYNFKSCFEHLQYQVHAYENRFASDIMKIVDGVAKEDHSNYDSFVFCISTHGEDNHYIFGSDGERINVYNLVAQIQACPTLRNKPKLFFIQACRAGHTDTPIVSGDGPKTVPPVVNKEADVAIFWATTRSQSAYRSPREGSWFVASIFKVFTAEALRQDLVTMMFEVTHVVSEMEGRESSSGQTVMQCVETSSQLRGAVYFM